METKTVKEETSHTIEQLSEKLTTATESALVQESKIENLNSSMEVLQHELQKTENDLQTARGELDQSGAEVRTLKVQLESTTAQKTEAEELVKAEVKKSSDLNGLLSTFREKLKTEREQGTVALTGMSDKLQTALTMATDAHAAEVARTTKVIGDIQGELSDSKARIVEVVAEKAILTEKSSDLGRKVADLTTQLGTAEQKETARASEVARLEGEAVAAQKVRRRYVFTCIELYQLYCASNAAVCCQAQSSGNAILAQAYNSSRPCVNYFQSTGAGSETV